MFVCFVFFFKQKTAYEMRISDWSSDVCSSDLLRRRIADKMPTVERPHAPALIGAAANFAQSEGRPEHRSCSPAPEADQLGTRPFYAWKVGLGGGEMGARSEEHTSELQ